MNILSEEVVTNVKAREILEKREKETELKYEQKNALDNLKKFYPYPAEKIEALVNELKNIEKLRDRQIVAILNFLPKDRDDLRVILQKEYSTFSDEEINTILEIVKKV